MRFLTSWVGLALVVSSQQFAASPQRSGNAAKTAAARKVEIELNGVLNSEEHRWFLGKMSPAERAARKKASEEFGKRYAQ